MTMAEIVSQVSFMLGFPVNDNIEGVSIEQGVLIAFRELKAYMRTPVNKTVPFSTRLDLPKLGINTVKVLSVQAAYPRLGMNLTSIESGNVFQVAASVNAMNGLGQGSSLYIDPIMNELALSQVRNTLATDFQWEYDLPNQCVYLAHRDPIPAAVTVRYVPEFSDVSEITNQTYIDYLVRMSEANVKKALGRSRSKYTIEGSNVSLDGETLLAEANAELEAIRTDLREKRTKMVVLN